MISCIASGVVAAICSPADIVDRYRTKYLGLGVPFCSMAPAGIQRPRAMYANAATLMVRRLSEGRPRKGP